MLIRHRLLSSLFHELSSESWFKFFESRGSAGSSAQPLASKKLYQPEISLGTYGEVLPHWTLDGDVLGHYGDTLQYELVPGLLQRNPIDGFQFSFQWCFSWTSQPVCQPVARVAPKKIWKGCMEKIFRKLAAAILTRRFTQYSPEANQTVRFLFAPTVTSSPHWTLDGDVFQSRVL